MIHQRTIEIELRSLFDEKKYHDVKTFLGEHAKDLGEDNKQVTFFLLPNKIAKVVHNVSKRTAKIGVKLNRLGSGSSDFEEIELHINPDDVERAVRIFSTLPFDQIQHSYQQRHNYFYSGVEIALKYSDSWGYHMELEIVVASENEKEAAEQRIRTVANKIGVTIMTEEEIAQFARTIDQQYNKKGVFRKGHTR